MPDGSVIDASDEHPRKTVSPMVVIPDGSVIDDNDEQFMNTTLPSVVIGYGRVIVWRKRQP